MSNTIKNRRPSKASLRLGLAMVGAGVGLAACGEATTHDDAQRVEAGASIRGQVGDDVADDSAKNETNPVLLAVTGAPCAQVDWSLAQLQVSATGSSPDAAKLASLSAQLSGDKLCVRVTGSGVVGGSYNLLVETDGKLSTGVQSLDSWAIGGAEYWVSAGALFKASTPLFSGGTQVGAATVTAGADSLVFELPRGLLEQSVPDSKIGLGFQLLENWAARPSLSLPAGPALVQLDGRRVGDDLDTTACPSIAEGGLAPAWNLQPWRSAIPLTKGVIAPLYLPVPTLDAPADHPDKQRWNLVSTAAAGVLTPAGAPIDFWVVLNGSSNGPPRTDAEWNSARAVWEPVGQSKTGGRLFGYVHTVKSVQDALGNTFVTQEFRPLAEVQNEITAWVTNLKELEGIWLDEFIPRYEVASGGPNLPGVVVSPNESLRPLDPNVTKYPLSFGALQVDPTCGYYDRLTRWIRASYPWLRIIGNPGSPLQNNQRSYARLVDVLVSYEHSLADASRLQWASLVRGYEPLARANLALVHGGTPLDVTTATRAQAIDEAFKAGFTHVYATDQLYASGVPLLDPSALGNLNVWGDLPRSALAGPTNTAPNKGAPTSAYLVEELNYVADKL